MNVLSIIQVINIALLILWPVLSLLALVQVRQKHLSDWHQIAWTLIILMIPVLGAIAFFVIAPEGQKRK